MSRHLLDVLYSVINPCDKCGVVSDVRIQCVDCYNTHLLCKRCYIDINIKYDVDNSLNEVWTMDCKICERNKKIDNVCT